MKKPNGFCPLDATIRFVMNTFLSTGTLALIIVGILLFLSLAGVLLYFVFFQHMRYKAQAKELIRRFEYLHSLLIGQDAHWVKTIERIATTNLLFASRHQTFEKRFKELRDRGDASAQKAVNDLKDLIEDRDYKGLKAALPEARRIMQEYDDAANSLHNDLHALILPMEECNANSLHMKEQFRSIKQDYFVKQSELSLCKESFETIFEKLDKQFDRFAELVSSAQYEEAKSMIPGIEKVLDQLARAIKDFPDYCASIEHVIPDKLILLKNAYEEMRSSGYPLQHLLSYPAIEDIEAELSSIAKDVKSFKRNNIQGRLDAIVAQIDGYLEGFEKEKDCRVAFDSGCETAYAYASSVEKKYIRLCNALPNVEGLYVIESAQTDKINAIKNTINKMGATKRYLDNLIHSPTHQPYSLLVEKMKELSDEAKDNEAAIEDFNRYLLSLKTDSETALAKVQSYYQALKEAKFTLREIALPSLSDKYLPVLDECLEQIDFMFKTLHKTPIDVAAINKVSFELSKQGDEALSGIKRDYEAMISADAAITFANRDRFRLSDLDAQLKQAEGFYHNGEFKKSYDDVTQAIRRLRGE